MNRKQKVAIVIGALVIVGLALFPPWRIIHTPIWSDGADSSESFGALHWVFSSGPDSPEGLRGNVMVGPVDVEPLQLAAAALTLAAVLVLKDRRTAP